MGGAPQRDVLTEQAMPYVVKREAEHGDTATDQEQQAADRYVPTVPDLPRGGMFVTSEEHRHYTGKGDAGKTADDQEVRRVGEGARVAAVVDVRRDVPVEAEHGDQ